MILERPLRSGLILAALLAAADQASKWWVLLDVMNPPRVIEVLPFFNLVLVWNQGISFGLFQAGSGAGKWLLIAVAAVVCAVLVAMLRKAGNRLTVIAVGLIIGGAVGNVIDRVVHGAVVDFFDVHAAGYHWPAFNIADSAIVIGAGLLILDSLTASTHNSDNEPADR
ncbi:MAG: signal peptidase II [Rhodospirillales bacterium]